MMLVRDCQKVTLQPGTQPYNILLNEVHRKYMRDSGYAKRGDVDSELI